jgi:hypothetical protein
MIAGLSVFLCATVDICQMWAAGMHVQAAGSVDEGDEVASLSTDQSEDRPEMIMIVSVPGLSFQEWAPLVMKQMPNMKRLAEQSGIAALNVRTPERGIEDVYLTINAGAPAVVPSGIQAYQVIDEADAEAVTSSLRTGRGSDDSAAAMNQSRAVQNGDDAASGPIDASSVAEMHELRMDRDSDGDATPVARGWTTDRSFSRNGWERFERFTGHEAVSGEIVVPELGYLVKINEAQTYGAQIGRLGDVLSAHGVRLAVFGHRIDGDGVKSDAPLMLMNGAGKLPGGNITEAWLIHDPSSPYGYRTDTEKLLNEIKNLTSTVGTPPASSSVILIEYGDWYSLDQERRNYASEQWETVRWRELRKLDELIGQLMALVETHSYAQLWVMSPQSHAEAIRAKLHVTPFILYEHRTANQSGSPGLLTSPTTKRPGLISLHDLGPTLLAAVGVTDTEGWLGFAAERHNRRDALQWLLHDVNKMRNVYELRTNVVAIFVAYEVLVLLLALLMVLLRWHKPLKWMRLPLISVLVAPLVILLLGFIPGYSPGTLAAVLIIVVFLISLCCISLPNWLSIFLIAVANAVVLLADGIVGSKLLKYSIMGYDPMIGARYYGIGNEYMGVLVGSAVLAIAMFVQFVQAVRTSAAQTSGRLMSSTLALPPRQSRHPHGLERIGRIHPRVMAVISSAVLIAITIYMAAPNGGTNAGGALTACAAFGVAWLSIFGRDRLRRIGTLRLLWIVAALLIVGLLLLWLLNQWLNVSGASGKSHIGRAMDLLTSGRIDLISGMIVRKLQMNLNLIRVSAWGKVLLTGIFVLAVLLLRPRGVLRTWQETRPVWMGGFTAVIVGAIVALALNDSGIVAAGTMIVYAAAPILLLVSEEVVDKR